MSAGRDPGSGHSLGLGAMRNDVSGGPSSPCPSGFWRTPKSLMLLSYSCRFLVSSLSVAVVVRHRPRRSGGGRRVDFEPTGEAYSRRFRTKTAARLARLAASGRMENATVLVLGSGVKGLGKTDGARSQSVTGNEVIKSLRPCLLLASLGPLAEALPGEPGHTAASPTPWVQGEGLGSAGQALQ